MLDPHGVLTLKEALPFWGKLSNSETALLLSGTRPVLYYAGELIHSPGSECVGVLLVKSGGLRTYLLSENGKEVTLFRQGRGDTCILSASCVLSSITFDVFIEAEQDSEVLLIQSAVFSQLQNTNLLVENFALRVTADRFSDVVWAMEQILFMRFDQRLAAFLLDETVKTRSNTIILTHEQIAKYIGSAREVVSRMLKYFVKEGFVVQQRGGIEVLNRAALQKLIQTKGK